MSHTQAIQSANDINYVSEPKKKVSQGDSLNVAVINLIQSSDVQNRVAIFRKIASAEDIVEAISRASQMKDLLRRLNAGEEIEGLDDKIAEFNDWFEGFKSRHGKSFETLDNPFLNLDDLDTKTLIAHKTDLQNGLNLITSNAQTNIQITTLQIEQLTKSAALIVEILSEIVKKRSGETDHIVRKGT